MTSSTKEDNSHCPTFMDYMALGPPSVIHISRFSNCMVIGEEENGKMMHVIKEKFRKIEVFDYEDPAQYAYSLWNTFVPTSICIKNNIVYITDQTNKILFLFTTEGERISRITHYYENRRNVRMGKLKAVEVDEENSIYMVMPNSVVVFNSTFPLTQKYPSDVVGRPKFIKFFKSEILILSWENNQVYIRILSVEGILLRRLFLNEFKAGNKPDYFDIAENGHIIIPNKLLNGINEYSGEGKLITTVALQGVKRPFGIKLLNDKKKIVFACSNRWDVSFVIL